ncbi:J domain-containing protein [Paraburkholderia sp. BCC1884]|uniref:J domain-containing protein n=1 Tax=Paraburkholderia sp. BCC1884 TaxID=2562668 RepID=UPI001182069A|nr:J domain-containing protein [Paraburkholderia sp. BCC1884]
MKARSSNHWPWDALGVESDADERAVRRAYAKLLKRQRPDEDAEGFQRLRYAYESALQMAAGGVATQTQTAVQTAEVGAEAEAPGKPLSGATRPVHDEQAAPREPDAFERAVQLWQTFVAQPDQLESRRSLQDLFTSVVNIETRDELEWQALCHCLNESTPATLRTNLSAVLGWRDGAHLHKRNAAIASLALNRIFADEDYDTLRLRYTDAMALLEGSQPQMATGVRMLLRAGVRAQLEQLLAALANYHANVMRLRLDAGKVEFWSGCLKLRIGVGRLFGPALGLNAWCGLLFATASLGPVKGWGFEEWGPTQLGVLLSTLMLALVGIASGAVLLNEVQQRRLRALRSIGWLRYGWVPVWLGGSIAALCGDVDGATYAIALGMLGGCTIWAALIHGWPPLKRLAITAAFCATASGLAGHWLAIDPHAWMLPYAHGVLVAFFLSFSQPEWRVWLERRSRVSWACAATWFAGFAALIALLLERDAQSMQLAWALFTLLSTTGGVLATARWKEWPGAIPSLFRGYVNVVWMVVAIGQPDVIACLNAGLLGIWIIEGFRQRGNDGT